MIEAAGETWPPPEGTTEDEIQELMARVHLHMMSQQIDAALADE